MKKHLFGFALFSFIVGTTAFIYAMLNIVNIREVPVPAYSATYSPTKSCWKMKRESVEPKFDSPKISQAVLNLKTKEFNWKLETPEIGAPIALHFFVEDKKGVRYIASEQVLMVVGRNMSEEMDKRLINVSGSLGKVKFTGSYLSLDNINAYQNLYLIAEFVSISQIRNNNFQPEFDAEKAIPVLIDSGK